MKQKLSNQYGQIVIATRQARVPYLAFAFYLRSIERRYKMHEEWKDINGYEGLYQISNTGKVKSIGRHKKQGARPIEWQDDMIIKQRKNRCGYFYLILHKDGEKKTKTIHSLVGEAFIENPEAFPQINHKDENKENNHSSNLEWCSASYNVNYGTRNERSKKTQQKPVAQLNLDGTLIKVWDGVSEAARGLGIYTGNISSCCKGRLHKTGGYRWESIGR